MRGKREETTRGASRGRAHHYSRWLLVIQLTSRDDSPSRPTVVASVCSAQDSATTRAVQRRVCHAARPAAWRAKQGNHRCVLGGKTGRVTHDRTALGSCCQTASQSLDEIAPAMRGRSCPGGDTCPSQVVDPAAGAPSSARCMHVWHRCWPHVLCRRVTVAAPRCYVPSSHLASCTPRRTARGAWREEHTFSYTISFPDALTVAHTAQLAQLHMPCLPLLEEATHRRRRWRGCTR